MHSLNHCDIVPKKRRKKKAISVSSCMLNSPLCPEGHGSKKEKKKGKEECARSERKKRRDARWMARFEIHATTLIVDDQLSHV